MRRQAAWCSQGLASAATPRTCDLKALARLLLTLPLLPQHTHKLASTSLGVKGCMGLSIWPSSRSAFGPPPNCRAAAADIRCSAAGAGCSAQMSQSVVAPLIPRARQPSRVFDIPTSPARQLLPVPAPEPEPDDCTDDSTLRPVCTTANELSRRLAQTVAEGQDDSVRECLAAGADVDALHNIEHHYFPITVLMLATLSSQPSTVRLLTAAGANTEVESRYGTAAEMACRTEQFACLEALANAGADLERKGNRSRTMLMRAAARGKIGLVRALIRAGADIEARDSGHRTPFILACTYGHVEVVAELLRAGCRVAAKGADGADGFQFAEALGHCAVVNLLEAWQGSPTQESAAAKQPQEGEQQVTTTDSVVPGCTKVHTRATEAASAAPAQQIRLAPQGSWALQKRDAAAVSLPRPESHEGTVLNFLCVGAGRARG